MQWWLRKPPEPLGSKPWVDICMQQRYWFEIFSPTPIGMPDTKLRETWKLHIESGNTYQKILIFVTQIVVFRVISFQSLLHLFMLDFFLELEWSEDSWGDDLNQRLRLTNNLGADTPRSWHEIRWNMIHLEYFCFLNFSLFRLLCVRIVLCLSSSQPVCISPLSMCVGGCGYINCR